MTAERVEKITRLLEEAFQPESLNVIDESHLHAGHAGAESGMGHFRVQIVAAEFEGVRPLAAHRKIYAALGDMMKTDIHALAIEASSPK